MKGRMVSASGAGPAFKSSVAPKLCGAERHLLTKNRVQYVEKLRYFALKIIGSASLMILLRFEDDITISVSQL